MKPSFNVELQYKKQHFRMLVEIERTYIRNCYKTKRQLVLGLQLCDKLEYDIKKATTRSEILRKQERFVKEVAKLQLRN